MTREDLFEAVGNIDSSYISEAYGIKQRHIKKNYKLAAALAALVLILAVCGWTVLTRPYLFFNGEANELDVNVLHDARILTASELETLGGVEDPGFIGFYHFDNTPLNELFSAMNISPMRSSRVDYDSAMYAETGIPEFGISSLSYVAADSATGKKFAALMKWYNTNQGLSMGETYMMMKNYEIYTMPCGAEALISLPEPGAPAFTGEMIPEEERTEEQQMSIERNVPDAFTWIWFTHDNIVYLIRAQHDAEEAKALLDSFS